MKILNFGSCNIDYVYELDHIVSKGETINSHSLNQFPGGKGLNQSIAMARSGEKVYHAGCIGEDGLFLKDLLEKSNVDVSFLKISNSPTGHAIIQLDSEGENCIIIYNGSNYLIEKEYIDKVFAEFGEGDILVLQNEISNLNYIISLGYKKKMKIVFNPSPYNEELKKIDLNMIDILILNETEGAYFSMQNEPVLICKVLTEQYENLSVVLTLGSKGSIYAHKKDLVYCSSYCVNVQDTTAAGDTFTGYFVSGMIKKMGIKSILEYSSAAASIAVSKKGAASSIPKAEEVKEAMKYLKHINSEESRFENLGNEIRKYIEDNIQKANLTQLAMHLGYSSTYTSVLVKKYTDLSFSELLQNERCAKAACLLKETDLLISDIISQCGYNNESFFRKIFSTVYGKNPNEYRNFYHKRK